MHITNFSMRNKCFFHHVLGLRYETSPGQFEWVLDELRHEIAAHPMVEESPGMPRVRMIGFGASSIDIDVRAYVMTTNYSEFLEIQEQLMLKIMHILEDAGTGFAFPSTTAYLGRDIGLDPYKAKRAEMLAKDRKQPSGDHAEGQEGPEAEEER
jgi:MscS family membrane protein